MRVERGLSSETIKHRCRDLKLFLPQVCDQDHSLAQLTISQIDAALIDKVNQAGYARCSIRSLTSTLRAFFRYAEQRGWCQRGLADAIKTPRVFRHETLPLSPSWDDVQRLIGSAAGACPADIRARPILLLLAVYGLRSSEICQLQLDDLDWERELINLKRVKQGPSQQLPLTHRVGEAILRYLREARPRATCPELFLTLRAPFRPLTRDTIYVIVSRSPFPLHITGRTRCAMLAPRG